MAIEVPRLPLEIGESITLEQLFKHVGKHLVGQDMVPDEFASDEWATKMADGFKEEYFPSEDEIVDDKEK